MPQQVVDANGFVCVVVEYVDSLAEDFVGRVAQDSLGLRIIIGDQPVAVDGNDAVGRAGRQASVEILFPPQLVKQIGALDTALFSDRV